MSDHDAEACTSQVQAVRRDEARRPFATLAANQIALLCEGLGSPQLESPATRAFETLSQPWSDWPVGSSPPWENDITDDGTPFEFSVSFRPDSEPKLRLLVEAQQRPLTTGSSWTAGLALQDRLARAGAQTARFDRVRDLFAPRSGLDPRFSIWHAADIDPDATRTAYKVYLNPQIAGPRAATGLVESALARLGLLGPVQFLRSRTRLRAKASRILYFSLDLVDGPSARVKVYVAHDGASAREIDGELEGCESSPSGDVSRWASTLLGTTDALPLRPILTCYAFSAPSSVPRVTVHFPVRCYVASDGEAVQRVLPFLRRRDADLIRPALEAFGGRALDDSRGMVTYLSLRRARIATSGLFVSESDLPNVEVTAYLAPQAYAFRASHRARAV